MPIKSFILFHLNAFLLEFLAIHYFNDTIMLQNIRGRTTPWIILDTISLHEFSLLLVNHIEDSIRKFDAVIIQGISRKSLPLFYPFFCCKSVQCLSVIVEFLRAADDFVFIGDEISLPKLLLNGRANLREYFYLLLVTYT